MSISARRERSDVIVAEVVFVVDAFQSTLLVRGATTVMAIIEDLVACISIHAPRERSDSRGLLPDRQGINFNPRSS